MGRRKQARVLAMTPAQRDMFLKVLGETGNASEAARQAGVLRGAPYNLRRRDEWFARDWDEALATAPERMAARASDPLRIVRRSRAGRTQLAAVRANQWNARDDEAFFAALERTGNVAASARAIGRDPNTAWRRRREWPEFARRFEAACDDAKARLEYGLIEYATNLIDFASRQVEAPGGEEAERVTPVEASFALQVVKWLDARERGNGRGARHYGPKAPDIGAVKAEILRKIEAMERHRRGTPEPDAGDSSSA